MYRKNLIELIISGFNIILDTFSTYILYKSVLLWSIHLHHDREKIISVNNKK